MPPQHASATARFNPANTISAVRIMLTAPVAWAVLNGQAVLAMGGLALVIASDLLDGFVARRRRQASPFGTLLDHGADALFVTVLAGVGAHLDLLPGMLAPLIAFAFMQYALDSRGAGRRTLRPSRLGRFNGIAYYLVITAMSVVHVQFNGAAPFAAVVVLTGWLLVATTIVSMVERAWHCVHAARGS